ncbi:MAG: type II toxin-antitoxin system VapC family toxin [Terriglobales bacterium]
MRVLLDTHVLLWWFQKVANLSQKARSTISGVQNQVVVSTASAWEMAIKSKSGKLDAQPFLDRLEEDLAEEGFLVLPITIEHAVKAGSLVQHHKDPFDRMLVAQAQAENLPIISNDRVFDRYSLTRIW